MPETSKAYTPAQIDEMKHSETWIINVNESRLNGDLEKAAELGTSGLFRIGEPEQESELRTAARLRDLGDVGIYAEKKQSYVCPECGNPYSSLPNFPFSSPCQGFCDECESKPKPVIKEHGIGGAFTIARRARRGF